MAQNGLIDLLHSNDMNIEQKIVEELLNNSNLDTKTELSKPMLWSCMKMIQEFLESKNLKISSTLLTLFIKNTFLYLISKDRKGRTEYLEALKGIKDRAINNPITMGNNQLTNKGG